MAELQNTTIKNSLDIENNSTQKASMSYQTLGYDKPTFEIKTTDSSSGTVVTQIALKPMLRYSNTDVGSNALIIDRGSSIPNLGNHLEVKPLESGQSYLGTSNNKWTEVWTSNLYFNTTITSPSSTVYNANIYAQAIRNSGTTNNIATYLTFHIRGALGADGNVGGKIIMSNDNGVCLYAQPTSSPNGGSCGLGSSTYPWNYAYFTDMPKVNVTPIVSKSGSITGSNGITLKFADGSQICYGYFTKTVSMSIAFGNIYYGTATNNITFSTKFTTKPTFIATLQDNDAINVSIMDQSRLTANSYTGRWLFNSPVSTSKTMTIGWVAFGLWK